MLDLDEFLEKAKEILERCNSRREIEFDFAATFRKYNFHREFPAGNSCKLYFRQKYASKPKDWEKYSIRIADYAHLLHKVKYAYGAENIVEINVQDAYCEKESAFHYYTFQVIEHKASKNK